MRARRSRAAASLALSFAAFALLAGLLLLVRETAAGAETAGSARPAGSSAPQRSGPAPGSDVRLRARHQLGVPLHPAPESSQVSGRIPDGTSARVLSVAADGRWFEIEADGVRGYVTRRYLELTAAPELASDSPWTSREACLQALARPRPARDPQRVRVGAWNLHWFPDGGPGRAKPGAGTDLEWLACIIVLSEVDVLALAEIKHGPGAEQALSTLGTRLGALGGGRFRSLLDDCPRGASQHVGLLYDERRARLSQHRTLGDLNPHGAPCKDQLRPGLAGHFAFPGGLDLTLVAVHLKSGPHARDVALRERSFLAFARAADGMQKLTNDRDVLVLGDMNTMGCESCAPPLSAATELERQSLRLGTLGFRRIPSDPPASHFYAGKTTLLDWAAASDLAELPALRRARVSGLCGELGGSAPRRELAAQRRLSDHCPFFLDIDDRDSD